MRCASLVFLALLGLAAAAHNRLPVFSEFSWKGSQTLTSSSPVSFTLTRTSKSNGAACQSPFLRIFVASPVNTSLIDAKLTFTVGADQIALHAPVYLPFGWVNDVRVSSYTSDSYNTMTVSMGTTANVHVYDITATQVCQSQLFPCEHSCSMCAGDGACKECHQGYTLVDGKCIIGASSVARRSNMVTLSLFTNQTTFVANTNESVSMSFSTSIDTDMMSVYFNTYTATYGATESITQNDLVFVVGGQEFRYPPIVQYGGSSDNVVTFNATELDIDYINYNGLAREDIQLSVSEICDGMYSFMNPATATQLFSTNSYYGHYSNNMACAWTYAVTDNGYFAALYINYSNTDTVDVMHAFNGASSLGSEIGQLSGLKNDVIITSRSNVMHVSFTSDSANVEAAGSNSDVFGLAGYFYAAPVVCPSFTATGTNRGIDVSGATGDVVFVQCLDGYSVGGGVGGPTSITFTCNGTGPAASHWSPDYTLSIGKCSEVLCNPYQFPTASIYVEAGSRTTLTGRTGTSIPMKCASGYSINGTRGTDDSLFYQSFTCSGLVNASASQWTPAPQEYTCQPMYCEGAYLSNTIENSTMVATYLSSVSRTCVDGYSYGNGVSTKTFSCTGLTSEDVDTYLQSLWIPDPTTEACSPVACAEYDHSSSTTASGTMLTGVTGDSIVSSCKPGYTFGGHSSTTYQQTFTCTASGPSASQWSPNTGASSSHCGPMNCNSTTVLGHVASGALLNGVTDDSATATCAYGYTFGGLATQKTFTCTGTGDATNAWQPDVSLSDNECLPMTCPTYTFADSAAQNVTYLSGVTGDSIVVTCSLGYVIGHTTATTATFSCTGTGNAANAWLPAPADNLCIQLQCNDYTHPANTVQSGAILSGGANSVAQSECVDGFSFGGGASQAAIMNFTCAVNTPPVTVSWSPDTSSSSSHCSPMNCAAYTDFTSDTVMPGSTLFGATNADSSVTCAYGYTVGGGSSSVYSSTYTCTGDSPSSGVAHNHWAPTPDANVCQAMNCPVVNFNITTTHTGFTLNGTTDMVITANCAFGYTFGGQGSTTFMKSFTCTGTGNARNAWGPDVTDPSNLCLPVNCPDVTFLAGKHTANLTGHTGQSRTITCPPGYDSLVNGAFDCVGVDDSVSVWQPDLASDYPNGVCAPAHCANYTFINGSVTNETGPVLFGVLDTNMTVTCADDYVFGGNSTIISKTFNCVVNPTGSGAVWDVNLNLPENQCLPMPTTTTTTKSPRLFENIEVSNKKHQRHRHFTPRKNRKGPIVRAW